MCQTQPFHSCNRSDSLNGYQVGESKLCSHPFTASKFSISQISLKYGQSPAEQSAQGLGEHTAMQTHLQQDEQLYQPDTHTWGFPLSQEYSLGLSSALCQHMHGLELANSEPTGCLSTDLPDNAAMISFTLSEAQPSMQSKRPSTVPPLHEFWLFCEV